MAFKVGLSFLTLSLCVLVGGSSKAFSVCMSFSAQGLLVERCKECIIVFVAMVEPVSSFH